MHSLRPGELLCIGRGCDLPGRITQLPATWRCCSFACGLVTGWGLQADDDGDEADIGGSISRAIPWYRRPVFIGFAVSSSCAAVLMVVGILLHRGVFKPSTSRVDVFHWCA